MAPGKSLQDEKKTNDPRRNVTWFLGSSWAHQCIADYLKLCSSDRHQKSFLASLFRLNLAASNSLLTLSASASAASELFPKCWSFSCHLVSLRPETLQIWRPESSRCNAATVLSTTQKTRIWHGALIGWELLLFLQHVRTREYIDAWTDWLVDSPWSCEWSPTEAGAKTFGFRAISAVKTTQKMCSTASSEATSNFPWIWFPSSHPPNCLIYLADFGRIWRWINKQYTIFVEDEQPFIKGHCVVHEDTSVWALSSYAVIRFCWFSTLW